MNWEEAQMLLKKAIKVDLHLTPDANFKFVREIPPYKCKNYNNEEGFRVQVGETSFVNIPFSMLQTIFEASKVNENTYNRSIFKIHFPRELNAKPCNVHSVGKLFEHAGIMKMVNRTNYKIIM
jgi:hypothetical protein